ncbi:Protein kinase C conserved region 2 (CalB) [Dermatophagoides pteronyssinus]|uniref:Protein kinase C conserved region 2 (CalB) n=1 Tax=Dermatophagoides pteronyssinus TaxID=6956 RepID=A0ABQ8ITP6_DERPT|nr:Protein kinase C conserved region 2 (CalB) [Dermatophagoides pteronyssinus]
MDDISNSGGSGSGGGGGGQQSQSTTTTISDSYIQSLLALIMDFCCINSNDHQSILSSSLSPSTMLFIFWTIVALIVAVAANIYLKIRKQQNNSLKLDKNEESITINDDDDGGEQSDWLQKSVSDHDKFKANHHSKQFDQPPKSNEPFVNRQEWMNEIIKWFYHQSHQDNQFISTITNEWLTSLNNKSQQLIIENGIFVEFVQIEQLTGAQLNQVKMAEELNENLITTMKATCDRLIIQVRVAPDCYGDPNRSAIYHVIMERFSSLLKVVSITDELLFVIRPLERPETRAQIEGPLLGSKNKFQSDVIINAVLNVFTSTIFDLNFSESNDKYPDFPRLAINESKKTTTLLNTDKPNVERKLLVKIAKANDLQLEKQDTTGAIYCTIELDEPFQSERTSIIREQIDSPEWDQHFIFNLNEKSRELLFELYEEQQQQQKSSTNKQTMKNEPIGDHILGNAIVNIKELISNPSQSQTLRLQSGMNNKQDMGNLIVEFLLMEHSRNGSIRRHDQQQQQQQQNQVTRSQSMTKPNNIDNHHDESVSSSSHIIIIGHHQHQVISSSSSSFLFDHHHHHRQRWSIGSALTTATLTDYCEDNHYGLATITDDGEKFYRNHHHSCQNQINFDDHQSKSSSSFMTTVEIDTIPNIETIISNCNNINLQQPNFKLFVLFENSVCVFCCCLNIWKKMTKNSNKNNMIRDIQHPDTLINSNGKEESKSTEIDNENENEDEWNNPQKRSSLYSQLSIESIDSQLDVVDNCTFNGQQQQTELSELSSLMMKRAQISTIELPVDSQPIQSLQMMNDNQEKRKDSKPLKRRTSYLQSLLPILTQQSTVTSTLKSSPQLSIRSNIGYVNNNNQINDNISKAKSDTQLFFCLYDDDYSQYYDDQFGIGNESDRQQIGCRRHLANEIVKFVQVFMKNGLAIIINNNKRQQSTPPPCSSISTTSSSSSSSAADSIKRKFKFRYSSKVSRKIAERLRTNHNNNENENENKRKIDNWHRTKREKSSSTPFRSCSLRYRASEPAINNYQSSSSSLSRKCRRNGFNNEYDDYDYDYDILEDPNYNSGENGHSISQLSNEPKQITTTTTTGTNEQRQQSARISATLDKRNSDSRPRDKSLLRNIKKRFSFNRRSKSVDRNLDDDDDDNFDNDYNNERIGHGMERARSVPGSREPSMPKDNNIHQQEPKIKESFGNLSQASTRTFMHEDSLLIMECNEKGTIKHIIVPTDDMEKARHDLKRRKSTKLHLYKDHLFIARHIPSSRLCQICGKKFAFRLGKQAYQCRDCGLICHKPCHVQVETRCFSSSIASLNLELIDGGYQQQLTLQHNNDNNNTNIMAVPELKITDTEPDDYFIINNNNNNSSIYR